MFYNLQVLRAVAAYLVVFAHLEALWKVAGFSIEPFGNSGVDLFFVISGFVMVYTTSQRPTTPLDFLSNRFVRVAPLYWLTTLAVFFLALIYPKLLGDTRASFYELFTSLLFIPFEKSNGLIQPVLFVGWTLNYEMFFYLVFSISLLFKSEVTRAAICCVVFFIYVAYGIILAPETTALQFYTNPIIVEFLFGMMLGYAAVHNLTLPRRLAILSLVVGTTVLLARFAVVPGAQRLWWGGLPSTAIVAGALSLEKQGLSLRNKTIQLLGAASYSTYLIHLFIARAGAKIVTILGASNSPLLIVVAAIIIICGIIFSSLLVHLYVELPLTRYLRKLVGHSPPIVTSAEENLGRS